MILEEMPTSCLNLRVVVVDTVLETLDHLIVPPVPLEAPILPAADVPEQPLQDTLEAPPDNVALSPSYEVSEGPAVIAPVLGLTTQFRYHVRDAVDPLMVSGNHIYELLIRLLENYLLI
jgi:hypothetical protein